MLSIKVLGPGCPNCAKVEAHTREALAMLQPAGGYDLVKVTDPVTISEYILKTPGLVINEVVVCEGRVPAKHEIMTWATNALENA
ncbi:MAG: thioredoxin family protein [Anaerolineae bacterium]|nr:thioredoxin family protein [Anaerolineae bacterium]